MSITQEWIKSLFNSLRDSDMAKDALILSLAERLHICSVLLSRAAERMERVQVIEWLKDFERNKQ